MRYLECRSPRCHPIRVVAAGIALATLVAWQPAPLRAESHESASGTASKHRFFPRDAGWEELEAHAPMDARRGYRVFSKSIFGSPYKAYRVEATVDAPPTRANRAARLLNLDARFVRDGAQRRILRREGDAVLTYCRLSAPAIADRDAVAWFEPLDAVDGSLGWKWRSTDVGPEAPPNVVRMPAVRGSWAFRAARAGRSHVVYESHADLGGSIPSWLIDTLIVGEQLKELEMLRDVLASHDDAALDAALARIDRNHASAGPQPRDE